MKGEAGKRASSGDVAAYLAEDAPTGLAKGQAALGKVFVNLERCRGRRSAAHRRCGGRRQT